MDKRLIVEALMSEEESSLFVTAEDRAMAAAFAPGRRREYLAWRAMIYRELGPVKIGYASSGAPVIENRNDLFLGVSHGAGRVALSISDAPCAVDIERCDRDFTSLISRYLTPSEYLLGRGDPFFPSVAWCAKEVLYKMAGRRGLSLTGDLHLTAVGNGWIEGCIKSEGLLRLSVHRLPDAFLVWYL